MNKSEKNTAYLLKNSFHLSCCFVMPAVSGHLSVSPNRISFFLSYSTHLFGMCDKFTCLSLFKRFMKMYFVFEPLKKDSKKSSSLVYKTTEYNDSCIIYAFSNVPLSFWLL